MFEISPFLLAAQKLLFGHTNDGDLLTFIKEHFDTTSGPKTKDESYSLIAKNLNESPSSILFVTDNVLGCTFKLFFSFPKIFNFGINNLITIINRSKSCKECRLQSGSYRSTRKCTIK